MKVIFALAMVVAITAFAATKHEDGSLTLTPEEVDQTIQYIRATQAAAIISNEKVIELENQVKLLKNSRCM
jgi:hypothetical protein